MESMISIMIKDLKDCMVKLNFHSITHFALSVLIHGPLWCYTTFPYEGFNSKILQSVHGTKCCDVSVLLNL
jgi:hypothetical protein